MPIGKQQYQIILLHFILWCILILPPYLFVDKVVLANNYKQFISENLFSLAIFYLNYFLLVSHFVSWKKIVIYLLFLAIISFFCFSIMLGYQLYVKDIFVWNTKGYLKNYTYNIPSILYYSVIAVFARSYYDLQKSLKREYQLKNEKISTELNYLKSQIDPHFFFNNLNNIYSLAVKKDENITVMISRLSDMMRSYIFNSRLSKISLEKEIDFIENFVYFQLLKKPKSTDIDVYSEGNLSDCFITPMLLINFVENAFKHSNIFHNPEASISINCFVDESKNLEFQVENTIYELPNQSVSGIGNTNTKRRLDLLYPDRYKLIEETHANMYSVVLKIYNKTK